MLLNCDLGESFGSWTMGMDEAVMPHIDQANIACGFHASDPLIMQQTLILAKAHGVMVGAHPSYPDLMGFGRRSMTCSDDEIRAFVLYQLSAMDGMAQSVGVTMEYAKPHGALYNDMMKNPAVRKAIMEAVAAFHKPLKLMLQANSEAEIHKKEASALGVELWFEAFADRCYDDDGSLLSRSRPGAVLSKEKILAQVKQLCTDGVITTLNGQSLRFHVDTLCVHGDIVEAVQAIEDIRQIVQSRAR